MSTPVDWQRGDRCLLDHNLSEDKANELFPIGYETLNDIPSKKDYLRFTAQPNLFKSKPKPTGLKNSTPLLVNIEKQDSKIEFGRRSRPNDYQMPPNNLKKISSLSSSAPLPRTKSPTKPIIKTKDGNFENNFEFLDNPSKKKSSKTKVIVCNCC